MVEGVLSGVTLLLIVCAPIRVLGWLFDHGHPGSLLCCSGPVAGMVWDVIVFAAPACERPAPQTTCLRRVP
jgi:hypothetical protein